MRGYVPCLLLLPRLPCKPESIDFQCTYPFGKDLPPTHLLRYACSRVPPLQGGRVQTPGKQLRIVFSAERAELTAKACFFGLALLSH